MNETNFESAKGFMEYRRSCNDKNLSGPGSYSENCKQVIELLNKILFEEPINSILDLGCGDWSWFQYIKLPENVSYTGWDCDERMINANKKQFGADNIHFEVKDICTTELPLGKDLIICRDVLFHMPIKLSKSLLDRIQKSSKYFLSTTFLTPQNNDIKSYINVKGWGFYKINLNIEPFNLSNYIYDIVQEYKADTTDKRFCIIYDFTMIPTR